MELHEIRKLNKGYREMRGFRTLTKIFSKMDNNTAAICDVISLNTEATLLLIDKLDAYTATKETA